MDVRLQLAPFDSGPYFFYPNFRFLRFRSETLCFDFFPVILLISDSFG